MHQMHLRGPRFPGSAKTPASQLLPASKKHLLWTEQQSLMQINKGDAYWVCMLCGQVFAAMATTSAIAHLNNNSNDLHRLQGPNSKKLPPQSSSSSSEQGQRSVASLFASQAARANSGFILQTEMAVPF
jgi:hypothetical protein